MITLLLQPEQDNLAYVSFTPSASNPHTEFADEVYFPPQMDEDVEKDLSTGPGAVDSKIRLPCYTHTHTYTHTYTHTHARTRAREIK
jgi:hypothetical protein